ncbi:hypothetical protein HMPREF0578_1777 [Mobiluncus mulieris 28-1]|uniref:Uncharacterized protein n=1 Tax=Mobiluncus mulieris ATCC 35239 TaxID=871571 RepID=E0QPL0_9ACTO|nr:hypothetical protein HMPREF0578_1777 [Mobiluncus mulieris 28-1]EFM46491.1 hypothetical protein HMPREF0580_0825 [Mobiluncus mulieris ATCC 35239]
MEHLTYSFTPPSLGGSGGSVGSVGAGVHEVPAPAEIQEKMGWRLYIF